MAGLIGAVRTSRRGAAVGMWTLSEQLDYQRLGTWIGDPNFDSVSLLLHMDGSNGSTTFTDSSSSALAVTVNGNAQISTAQSKFGGASALFDGASDYLTLSSSTAFLLGTQDFTIECWVRLASTSGTQAIVTTADPTDAQGFYLGYDAGNYLFLAGASASWSVNLTLGAPTLNTWQHLCAVRSGNTFTTYRNGVQQATATSALSLTNTNNQIRVGGRANTSQWFNGYVDEVRITKGVARYTANFTVPSNPFPNA